MDRLQQLRGDSDASRDSTLDTPPLLGEGYMAPDESFKYYCVPEDDSSTTASQSKEAPDEVTAESSTPHVECILPNLSPIPETELDSVTIAKQIEAANILTGGANIFDDYDNSYDGYDLVIDEAGIEGDDPSEVQLDEQIEETLGEAEANVDDPEAVNPSTDTKVVLQIDGKNVSAIDIGNGLYLYKKEGEDELATVQVLDDNQQQSAGEAVQVCYNPTPMQQARNDMADHSRNAPPNTGPLDYSILNYKRDSNQYWTGAVEDPQNQDNFQLGGELGNEAAESFWNTPGESGYRFYGSDWLWSDTDYQPRMDYLTENRTTTMQNDTDTALPPDCNSVASLDTFTSESRSGLYHYSQAWEELHGAAGWRHGYRRQEREAPKYGAGPAETITYPAPQATATEHPAPAEPSDDLPECSSHHS